MPRPKLETIRAEGAISFAAWHVAHSYSDAATLSALRLRWPDATNRTLAAALNQGKAAFDAGAALSYAPRTERILAHDVPGPTTSPRNYHYSVLLELLDEEGELVGYWPYTVKNARLMDSDELRQSAIDDYQSAMAAGGQRKDRYSQLEDLTPGDIDVIYVERL